KSHSLEAVYPFDIKGDRFAYHANPNVCTIATAVNYTKKRQASICLPLFAHWFNTIDDAVLDLKTRKYKLTWIYDGFSNTATMGDIFLWSSHLPSKLQQRQVLEALRTGEKRHMATRLLLGRDSQKLLHTSENRWGIFQPSTIEAAMIAVYPTLVKIREQYGLTKEESTTS
ncbi:hypothetical protein M440DRAFT_1447739, partial [Trichoderma longibrachiatum ATCC 18648]